MKAVRSTPVPAAWSVSQGRDDYLAENGFTVEAYDDKWTKASFMGLEFAVPNTPRHRRAIMLHDLHHVATGFGTDLSGEGEISAWELRRGLGALGLYVGSIVVAGTLLGLVVAPRRTLRAWKRSGRDQRSLFGREDYDELLELSVGQLREELGLPVTGIATKRGLHSTAPQPATA